jgi:hypothetical protein
MHFYFLRDMGRGARKVTPLPISLIFSPGRMESQIFPAEAAGTHILDPLKGT